MVKAPRKPRNLCHEGRTRVTVWLENKLVEKIRFDAKERFITQQSIIESALRDAYRPPAEDLEAFIARRFNYVDTTLKKLDSQSQVTAEALALFLRLWLAVTPKILEVTTATTQIQEFYTKVLRTIESRIANSHTIFKEVEAVMEEKR